MAQARLWLLLLVIFSVFLAAACNRQPEVAKELTLGTSASVNASFVFYAKHLNLFAPAGIELKIIKYPSASLALQDMLDGKIDIAGVAETPLAFASLARSDFSILATLCSSSNDPKIVVRSDRNISGPQDLAGKRIGTTGHGQSAHFFLHLFLLKNHIPETAVTVIHDSPANIVHRLVDGDLDGAALFEPYLAQATESLGSNGEVFAEPGLYYKTFNLVARHDTLKKEPELIARFVKCLLAGETALHKNEADAVSYLSKELETSPDVVRNYFRISDFSIFLSNATAMTILDEAKWARENGFATGPIEVPDIRSLFYTDALRKYTPERVTVTGN